MRSSSSNGARAWPSGSAPTTCWCAWSGARTTSARPRSAECAPGLRPDRAAARAFLLGAGGQLDRAAAGNREGARGRPILGVAPARRAGGGWGVARGATARARLRTAEGLDEALAGAVAHALTSVRLALIHHARRRLLADDRPG